MQHRPKVVKDKRRCECKNPRKNHACEKDILGILLYVLVKVVNI